MQAKYYLKKKIEKTGEKPNTKTISVLLPMEVTHVVMELRGEKKIIDEVLETLKEKFEIS